MTGSEDTDRPLTLLEAVAAMRAIPSGLDTMADPHGDLLAERAAENAELEPGPRTPSARRVGKLKSEEVTFYGEGEKKP